MGNSLFIRRLVLSNYKSIASCSLILRPLSFLVGPNGSGKSNIIDSLRVVTESLTKSLEHALRERGGINEVRRRSSGHPTHFGIRVDFSLPNSINGYYAFKVGAKPKGGFVVQQEACSIYESSIKCASYEVISGKPISFSEGTPPPAIDDRLYLVTASGFPAFRPLYDALTHMGFYSLNPEEIRDIQPPDTGNILFRDGRNLASVLSLMTKDSPRDKRLVVEYLAKVVPGITGVDIKHIGKKETLEFRQVIGSNKSPWRFMAENMSDGTLRALGILTALFQSSKMKERGVRLIGIEEPEIALHPGAAGILREALRAAAENTQVIVTSHSPDLLDDEDIDDENIFAVSSQNGATKVGPINSAERNLIREQLFTVGDLLRMNQLSPDIDKIDKTPPSQLDLFYDMNGKNCINS